MPIKTKELESKLVHKFGFELAKGKSVDHRWYKLVIPGCIPVMTKMSHGITELSTHLEGLIARQLKVNRKYLVGMIECTNSADSYIDIIKRLNSNN